VISGKEYTGKISQASGFCPVPVNEKGIFIFRNHLKTRKNKLDSVLFIKINIPL